MTFDEWAEEYFGKNVDVPEACRDAWNAATKAEREANAQVCDGIADAISHSGRYGEQTARQIAATLRSNAALTGKPRTED